MERKTEEIYMHDADGEEMQGIHRRVQSGRERQEKRAGHCSWIQEPVVMVALQRQCRIVTNNYSRSNSLRGSAYSMGVKMHGLQENGK